jgi:hypothetical protein
MPYWKPLTVNGKPIDLSHLEPFQFAIVPTGFEFAVTINVYFFNHCFSEAFDEVVHKETLPTTHTSHNEKRAFNRSRYDLSKTLAGHIKNLNGKRISQARHETLIRVTLQDQRQYGIFFTLKKSGDAACDLFVVSAYLLDRPKAQIVVTGEMKFNVAVAKIIEKKKLKFPSGRF